MDHGSSPRVLSAERDPLSRAAQLATLIGMNAGFFFLGGAVGYVVGLRRGRLAHLGRYSRSLSMVNQDFTL